MITSLLIAWGVVGFAGGCRWSLEAYTFPGVMGRCVAGIFLGPLSFLIA